MAAVPASSPPPSPDAIPAATAATAATVAWPATEGVFATPRQRRRGVTGWVLYDSANTLLGTNLAANAFPLWVVAQGGGDSVLALATTVATILTVIAAPVVGALSDRSPRRVPILVALSVGALLATLPIGHGGLGLGIVLFVLAAVCMQAALIVYDALLLVVSTPASRGRISGLGVGIGYLGTIAAILIGTGVRLGNWPTELVFVLSAVAFGLLALPCFLWVREPARAAVVAATVPLRRRLGNLLAPLREDGDLRRLLLARVLYGNAANTILIFTAIYATAEVGFSPDLKDILLLAASLAALGGALIWGRAADRIGAQPALLRVMGIWALGLGLAAAVPLAGLPSELYWLAAVLAGSALGGTWAVDRTLLLNLAAPETLGQTLGLYAMVGRTAGLGGPLLWALVADGFGWGRPAAMLAMLGLIAAAAVALGTIRGGRV
ncbi:MAG: MFS transporter [Chloroflexia bacterium]|nr:MFS transporter [Chloroflexia bacterium]